MHGRRARARALVLLLLFLPGLAACGPRGPAGQGEHGPDVSAVLPVLRHASVPAGTAALPTPRGSSDLVLRTVLGFGGGRVEWAATAGTTGGRMAVYRLGPGRREVASTAAALASALGMTGAPERTRGTIRYEAGAEAVLVVSTGGGQRWTYARDGAGCTDIDGTADAAVLAECARVRDDDHGDDAPRHSPVSAERARRAAAPVFAAAGVATNGAVLTTGWGATLVSVDPLLDKAPTAGFATGVLVDRRGVRAAAGWLGAAVPAAAYDVRPLADLLGPGRLPLGQPGCLPSYAPGQTPSPCLGTARVVTDAAMGYQRWETDEGTLAVPVWLGRDGSHLVGVLQALEPDYLPEPVRPRTSG